MTREITMRLHDTHVGIWQDDANDPAFRAEIFGPLIRHLRDHGWTVGSDPRIVEHYNCLRHTHRLMRKGNLRGTIEITGRLIALEIWAETWPLNNPNGQRYDFDKRKRLNYLDRLRVDLLKRQIEAWLRARADVTVTRTDTSRLTPMQRIERGYAESPHTDKSLGRPVCNDDYNRKLADGSLLEQGQTVWIPDSKGRILRGTAYYNLNSMWWVIAGGTLYNKACHEICAHQPADLRTKLHYRLRRERLERAIGDAVMRSDFSRAETLCRITFGNEPIWRIWSRKHDAYYGSQYCGYTSDAAYAGRYTRAEAEAEARRVPHILMAIAPDGRRISFGEGA
ncbi:hypothetical protein [Paenirhodobacter enshiensis]|uniref:hypothetical protein n=1 Tax=Paenirhodobacter enshiensis TaxID=1105367 RepID=UPI0035ADCFF7